MRGPPPYVTTRNVCMDAPGDIIEHQNECNRGRQGIHGAKYSSVAGQRAYRLFDLLFMSPSKVGHDVVCMLVSAVLGTMWGPYPARSFRGPLISPASCFLLPAPTIIGYNNGRATRTEKEGGRGWRVGELAFTVEGESGKLSSRG